MLIVEKVRRPFRGLGRVLRGTGPSLPPEATMASRTVGSESGGRDIMNMRVSQSINVALPNIPPTTGHVRTRCGGRDAGPASISEQEHPRRVFLDLEGSSWRLFLGARQPRSSGKTRELAKMAAGLCFNVETAVRNHPCKLSCLS